MQKKGVNNKKNGITLVELIVSIGILSIILIAAFNLNIFGQKTFNKGVSKAEIQTNLRFNADYICEKIRYASNVKILQVLPTFDDSTKSYEYIYSDGGVLKHYSYGTIETIIGNQTGLSTTLSFGDKDTQTVYFKITGTYKDETYNLDSSVYMLNIGTGGLAESTGSVIQFTKGVPVNANVNAKPVQTIAISASPSYVEIGPSGTLNFNATVTPADASINTVTWIVESTPAGIASIKSTGPQSSILTALSAPDGASIMVKAKALDGSGVVSAPYYININKDLLEIPVLSVEVKSSLPSNPNPDYIFQKGGTLQMYSDIFPVNATNKNVNWAINQNNSVATIDESGVLKTNAFNTSLADIVVTATSKTNTSAIGTKTIKVIPNISSSSDLYIKYVHATGNDYNISIYLKDGYTLVSYANGIKAIKYYINSGTPVNTSNQFIAQIKNKETIYITLTPLTGPDIITHWTP